VLLPRRVVLGLYSPGPGTSFVYFGSRAAELPKPVPPFLTPCVAVLLPMVYAAGPGESVAALGRGVFELKFAVGVL